MRLAGKACIVTGAGSGIGRASALLFAAEGGSVAVADIDGAAAAETVDAIEASGDQAFAHVLDVADPKQAEGLAAAVLGRFGRIDVLFNNAGIAGVGDALETT